MDARVGAEGVLVWSPPFNIELGWLDANGHLNMAYYHVMFDRTVDIALTEIACGDAYREAHNAGIFNVETHVVYRREVRGDDQVRVSFQLVSRDQKRLHAYQTMVRMGDDELVAVSESLFVHVDLGTRKVAPLPGKVIALADEMIERQEAMGPPPLAGRRIARLVPAPAPNTTT
ncbi:MAG: thioesterase family protein [Pseudomonadota bacterium]